MDTIWVVSMVLQWVVIGVLSVVVVALVRQLGVLTVRLNPAAGYELDEGPQPGTNFPVESFETLAGDDLTLGGSGGEPTVVMFVSPGCGMCTSLAPSFRSVHKAYAREAGRLVIAVTTDRPTAVAYAREHKLKGLDVIAAGHLAKQLNVTSTPYAVAVGSNGVVAKRGITNALEHLEEMMSLALRGTSFNNGRGPRSDAASAQNGAADLPDADALILEHVGEEKSRND